MGQRARKQMGVPLVRSRVLSLSDARALGAVEPRISIRQDIWLLEASLGTGIIVKSGYLCRERGNSCLSAGVGSDLKPPKIVALQQVTVGWFGHWLAIKWLGESSYV
jgi:hypothetical protein